MPEALNFKPKLEGEKVIYYTAYNNGGEISGFIVKAEGKGYSSPIEAMAGLSPKMEITNIKILSQNETPGLGNRIMQDSFLSRFKGKGVDFFNQVQAITGATISSRAVINSIRNEISKLKNQLLEELQHGR